MGITINGSSAAGNIDLGTNGTITDLAVGGLPDGSVDADSMASIPATKLTGTIADARFPATLPAVSGASLTNLPSSPAAYRNLLDNGALTVHQRGNNATNKTSNGYYGPDRWKTGINHGGFTITQETSSPPTGFTHRVQVKCATQDTSIDANASVYLSYSFEGNELQSILKGTSDAKQLTLSFWVKAGITGTCIAEIYDSDHDRHCCKSYTINTADTWEKKTLTFPADTTGVFGNDNAESLKLLLWLTAGTNYTSGTLQTTWASTTKANRVVGGNMNFASNVNEYATFAGIQLETGDTATDFEYRAYGDELARCQRYFWMYYYPTAAAKSVMLAHCWSASSAFGHINFPCRMRTAPSSVLVNGTDYWTAYKTTPNTDNFDSVYMWNSSENSAILEALTNLSVTEGQSIWVTGNNASASIAFSSEL